MAESSEEKKNPEGYQKPEVFCVPVQRRQTERGILGLGEGVEESRKEEWYLPKAEALGDGVSSHVHKACKPNHDCDYVMKIILFNPEVFPDTPHFKLLYWFKNTRDNFLKEVKLHKEAFDLNVAPEIIDSWICENPYMGVIIMTAMERTLEDVLIDPNVSADEKKRYIKDAMKILIRLRENNIFHGDAHPKNFMVDSNGTLKIIDFGLSEKAITPLDFLFLKKRLYALSEIEPVLNDILQSMFERSQNS